MARSYIVPATNITLANQAVTLAFVNAGTTASLKINRAYASYGANTTGAQQRVQLSTQVTAFPTLTSQTPQKLTPSDPASAITGGTAGAAGTSGINASAEGAGAKTIIIPDAFYNLNGWLWVPGTDDVIVMPASGSSGLGLHFPAAAATLTNWNAGIVYTEL
jgi:hypothetical protein